MSSTISTIKTVSVGEQTSKQDEQETDEQSIVASVTAAFDWLFGTVGAEKEDETSDEDTPDGYTYRQLAGRTSGVRNIEYQEGIESAEDVYEQAFERLSDTTTRSTTEIARGVEYDLTQNGLAGRKIGQRRAEQGRLNRGRDVHRNDIPWRDDEGNIDEDALQMYTLSTQERIEADIAELELISKQTAGDFEQDERGDRSMEAVTTAPQQTVVQGADESTHAIDQSEMVVGGHPEDAIDPRARLGQVSQTALGAVNKQAAKLAEEYEHSQAALSKHIAERITSDTPAVQDIIRAVSTVRERLDEAPAVVSSIDTIDPEARRVSVAGTITQLFHPMDLDSQAQVGYIDDGTGSAKVTVWKKSESNTLLHEGDEVVIKAASPGMYDGRPTLAVRHDSVVIIRKTGDGSAKASRNPAKRSESSPQCRKRMPGALTPSLGSSDPVPRPDHDRHQHIEETIYFPEHVPAWFPHRPDVRSLETVSKSKPVAGGHGAYSVISRRRYEKGGVSWADKKRREAKKNGRKRRLLEKKYDIDDGGTKRANDEYYKWKLMQQFGADDQFVHVDLPWPGHERAEIPTFNAAHESLEETLDTL